MISLQKIKDMSPLQKLLKIVGDLGKTIFPQALKSCPNSNKSPNLVTLLRTLLRSWYVTLRLGTNGNYS